MIVIAEIGQNHNGSLDIAKQMIEVAKGCGADYVKFAKRDPEVSVPRHMWDVPRETPNGVMPYIEYRKKLEFGQDEYEQIDEHCKKVGILWFASASDVQSFNFLRQFDLPIMKIPSAKNTDLGLLTYCAQSFSKDIMVSVGMIGEVDVDRIVMIIGHQRLVLMHCVSAYPAPNDQINLMAIPFLREKYPGLHGVGYSGHEIGLQISLAAVALGATWIERHFTLSRAMWGSDQSSSVEPEGIRRLCRDARVIESAMGVYGKFVQECEHEAIRRLR